MINVLSPRFYTPVTQSWYGWGRTVAAIAQLSILLVTPQWALRVPVGGSPAPSCDGLERLSAFCLGGDVRGFALGHVVAVLVLVVVAFGWRPRWTAVPHAWVTVSLLRAITLPDGGEAVMAVMTLLMVPLCLADNRRWHWTSVEDDRPSPRWSGVAAATQQVLRAQIALIYLHSGLAKLGVPDWANGSAMYYVTREHYFGATGAPGWVLRGVTETALGTAALSWGTILVEVAIAVLIVGPASWRRVALVLAVALHVGIIVGLGLWSFGLVMCGVVAVAACLPRPVAPPADPAPPEAADAHQFESAPLAAVR